MPARKAGKKGAAKKGAGGSKKAGARALPRRLVLTQDLITRILRRREWVMYGIPIRDVIATGDIAQMRRAAQITRTHLADVEKSLGRLDEAIRAGGR